MCDLLLIGEVLAKRSVDDPLGTGILSLDLLPGSSTGEVWVQLEGVRSGSVLVEVSVEPDPTRGALAKEGLVTVRIIRAKNLIAADACGTSDPYCVLSLGSDSLMNFAKAREHVYILISCILTRFVARLMWSCRP
jgi:Ca2+-dependent lipid-binding protein